MKYEQNRMVRTIHKWLSVNAILEDVSMNKTIVGAKILIQRLSSFIVQKLRHSDTCNQVKSCTKHGRPDQSQQELTVALILSKEWIICQQVFLFSQDMFVCLLFFLAKFVYRNGCVKPALSFCLTSY